MSTFKAGVAYWMQVFLIPIYLLSFLMPRSKKIWVMGSTFGRRFADNPRYFYLYMNEYHKDEIKAVWISKNKELIAWMNEEKPEYPAYYLYSIKGIWHALRAGVYLYDNYSKDICFTLSGGAKKINLWHGIPLKKIQMDNAYDKVRHPKNRREKLKWMLRRMSDERPSDSIVVSSPHLADIFSSAFQTKNVLVTGYPRNEVRLGHLDALQTPKEKEALTILREKRKEGRTVLLYMPTFRGSEKQFFDVIDSEVLSKFLEESNSFLAVKLHPKSKLNEAFCQLEGGHIKLISKEADPYAFLDQTDILITDYSSIYFDYLLLDRPIIFFSYDMETYLLESREFYFEYEKVTPGCRVKDQQSLFEAIREMKKDEKNSIYSRERRKWKDYVFQSEGGYCEALYKKIR